MKMGMNSRMELMMLMSRGYTFELERMMNGAKEMTDSAKKKFRQWDTPCSLQAMHSKRNMRSGFLGLRILFESNAMGLNMVIRLAQCIISISPCYCLELKNNEDNYFHKIK